MHTFLSNVIDKIKNFTIAYHARSFMYSHQENLRSEWYNTSEAFYHEEMRSRLQNQFTFAILRVSELRFVSAYPLDSQYAFYIWHVRQDPRASR
jgi:hypothetical protein